MPTPRLQLKAPRAQSDTLHMLMANQAECNAKLTRLLALQEASSDAHFANVVRSFAYCAAICVAARLVQTWLMRLL